MVLAILLLLFLLIVGPTVFHLRARSSSRSAATSTMIVPASFRTGAFGDSEWLSALDDLLLGVVDLVGALRGHVHRRISKGRTVREFVIGVLLIPSGVSFVWFAVFGGAAIDLQLGGSGPRRASSARPRSRSSRCSRSSRSRRHLVRRDRAGGAVLRQRRGRRIAGDGHAVLAREPRRRRVPWSSLWGVADRRVGRDPAAVPAASARSSRPRSSPRRRSRS